MQKSIFTATIFKFDEENQWAETKENDPGTISFYLKSLFLDLDAIFA